MHLSNFIPRAVLLMSAAAIAVGCRGAGAPDFLSRATPHEAYARSLETAGLADTALARDWHTAAQRALALPKPTKVPFAGDVVHEPVQPSAYGYRLELKRGRVLRVDLDVQSSEPVLVFMDLFAATDLNGTPDPIASAERHSTILEHEIERDGTYVLRIQPELLRGGTLKIAHRTSAAFAFPVKGRTTSAVQSFFLDPRDNNTREHHGIDIFAPRHTPVLAVADGYVTSVATTPRGGHVVWIWHPERRQSHYYAHLQKQVVTTGTHVKAGDVVGYVGNTGNARTTPPHLHFGIYSRGDGPINPLPWVAP
jgi:peptidoglycan LD-endopeptidase LytH